MRIWLGALVFLIHVPAFAFEPRTHEQMIKSMIAHLKTYPHWNSATDSWLGDPLQRARLTELLVRATVDEDYRTNIRLGAPFHEPFVGAKSKVVDIFTTFTHHFNVTAPGTYWKYDGYAYRHTDGTGNDKYLGIPIVVVKGELSPALGGRFPSVAPLSYDLGLLDFDFLGTSRDWRDLFFGTAPAADAVFPPANVPAEIAYGQLLHSGRASRSLTREWNEDLILADGLLSNTKLSRRYRLSEIAGLPRALSRLGTVLHMFQDISVPHHVEGIASYCHPEFEVAVNQLACGRQDLDPQPYNEGTFDDLEPDNCQRLYEPSLVEELRDQIEAVDPTHSLTISERMEKAAFDTVRFRWGKDPKRSGWIRTELPSGHVFSGPDCSTLLRIPEVQARLFYQYNYAVALSVAVLEIAAKDYEMTRETLF